MEFVVSIVFYAMFCCVSMFLCFYVCFYVSMPCSAVLRRNP